LGGSSGFKDVDLIGYAVGTDSDGDGLSDYDENADGTRDLDPDTPGVQNPFDPYCGDSTGNNGSNEPDGIRDGLNDYDGDGVNNETEFMFGLNPIDAGSCAKVPSSGWPVLLAAACFLVLCGIRKISDLSKC